MLTDVLERIFTILQGSIVNIPVDNIQGAFYVILNLFLLILATITGSGTST